MRRTLLKSFTVSVLGAICLVSLPVYAVEGTGAWICKAEPARTCSQQGGLISTANDVVVRAQLSEQFESIFANKLSETQRKITCLQTLSALGACDNRVSNEVQEIQKKLHRLRIAHALSSDKPPAYRNVPEDQPIAPLFAYDPEPRYELPSTRVPAPLSAAEAREALAEYSTAFQSAYAHYARNEKAKLIRNLAGNPPPDGQTLAQTISRNFSMSYVGVAASVRSPYKIEVAQAIGENPELLWMDTENLSLVDALKRNLVALKKMRDTIRSDMKRDPDLLLTFTPMLANLASQHPDCAPAIQRALAVSRRELDVAHAALTVLGIGSWLSCVLIPESVVGCLGVGSAVSTLAYLEASKNYNQALDVLLSGFATEADSNVTPQEILARHNHAMMHAMMTLLKPALGSAAYVIGVPSRMSQGAAGISRSPEPSH